MRIFVAASFLRIDEARLLRDFLTAAGHEVIAEWLDAPAGEEYVHADEAMAAFAVMDGRNVMAAQALVCLTGDPPDKRSRGGCHCEFGGALFTGRRVFLLGPREMVHHWHPAVNVARSLSELIELLAA